jgi:hypothetical protein
MIQEEARVKVVHYVIAASLSGALAAGVASARPHHVPSKSSEQGSAVTNSGQKAGNGPSSDVSNKSQGEAKGERNSNESNGSDSSRFGGGAPLKKGEVPGGSHRSGTDSIDDAGKGHTNNLGEGVHQDVTHAAPNSAAVQPGKDAIRTDNVIVERPNRNKKQIDFSKKPATAGPAPIALHSKPKPGVRGVGGSDRNAIGVAINSVHIKKIDDDKVIPNRSGEISSPSGPINSTTGLSRHPLFRPARADPVVTKVGGMNGTLITHPGVGPGSIGGLAKNTGLLNGTSFGPPKHPGFNR